MRYMGIDYGKVHVGIALSDESGTMGFPNTSFINSPHLMEQIGTLIKKENVGGVVFGVSADSGGKENDIVQEVRIFAETLRAKTDIPVFFQDESFSTQEARYKKGKESFLSRIRNKVGGTGRKDASAATLILNRFLEKQKPL